MSPQSNSSVNFDDMSDEQFAAIAAARKERKKAEAIAKRKAEEERKKAEAAAAEMDIDGEGEDNDVNVDRMDEDEEEEAPKGKRTARVKGKEKEKDPETKVTRGGRNRKSDGSSLTLNVPLVHRLIPYIEIDLSSIPQPGSHIYAPKCSNCTTKKIPCWADEKGKACTPCASRNKRCDHSSKGPAAKKKKDQEAAGNVDPVVKSKETIGSAGPSSLG